IAHRPGNICMEMLAGGGERKLTAGELLEDADAGEQSHYAEKGIGLSIHFAGESLYRDGIVAHMVRHPKPRHASKRKRDLLASHQLEHDRACWNVSRHTRIHIFCSSLPNRSVTQCVRGHPRCGRCDAVLIVCE